MVRIVKDHKAPVEEPVLKRLSDLITGLTFRILYEESYLRICKSNARSNLMTLFMMFALQQLCGLSDKELEYQVNGRRTNEEYFVLA